MLEVESLSVFSVDSVDDACNASTASVERLSFITPFFEPQRKFSVAHVIVFRLTGLGHPFDQLEVRYFRDCLVNPAAL